VQDLLSVADAIKADSIPKPWQVWRSPAEAEFLTSDNLLVTFLRLTDEVWHPGLGFRVPIAGPESKDVDEATLQRVNEIVIRCSDRFVYSKTRSAKIEQMVNDCARTSVPGETAFVGQFPDEERIEAYVRRQMGIRARAA
jgi:hypothetical protein